MWLAAEPVDMRAGTDQGRFVWPSTGAGAVPGAQRQPTLTRAQFDALVLGLPWQRLEHMQAIAMLYGVEQEARQMSAPDRLRLRQLRARPLWDALHAWLRW